MKLLLGTYSSGLAEINAEHNGEVITFKGGSYARTKVVDREGFFLEINSLWAGRSEQEQQRVFDVYKRIDTLFNSILSSKELRRDLRQACADLVALHPMDELNYWIRMKSKVKYPADVKDTYSPEYPKEMTYLRSDYTGLLTLTLGHRLALPIFSRYMIATEKESGGLFKEYLAMTLFDGTELTDNPYMDRLRNYVVSAAAIDESKPSTSAILNGLGSSQLPGYLLAMAVIRRVAVSEMRSEGEPVNIVANVWNFVSKLDVDKKFGGATRDKTSPDSRNEDDKQSVGENYKTKQEVSEASTLPASVYVERYIDVHREFDDTVDLDRLDMLYERLRVQTTFEATTCQKILVGWVLSPTIAARSVPYLEPEALVKAVATTQALLWHWGFPDLAALMTASPSGTTSDESVMGRPWVSGSALYPRLDEQYPHWKRTTKKGDKTGEYNYALVSVKNVFEMFTATDWELRAPDALLQAVTMEEYETGYEAPLDLEYQLIDFIIKNNDRKAARQEATK